MKLFKSLGYAQLIIKSKVPKTNTYIQNLDVKKHDQGNENQMIHGF